MIGELFSACQLGVKQKIPTRTVRLVLQTVLFALAQSESEPPAVQANSLGPAPAWLTGEFP